MTDAPSPFQDQVRAAFEVAPTVIPVGVWCRTCGRSHLPARLWPLAIRHRPGGGAEIDLRCVRCHAVGSLPLEPDITEHRSLLAVWRGQVDGTRGDAKAPA